jgi:hypothetical protein
MKKLFGLFLLSLPLLFVGCDKDDSVDNPAKTLIGYWLEESAIDDYVYKFYYYFDGSTVKWTDREYKNGELVYSTDIISDKYVFNETISSVVSDGEEILVTFVDKDHVIFGDMDLHRVKKEDTPF